MSRKYNKDKKISFNNIIYYINGLYLLIILNKTIL